MNFLYFFSPILGIAISSLMNKISGSKTLPNPVGIGSFLYDLANPINMNNNKIDVNNIENTFLVIEKSKINKKIEKPWSGWRGQQTIERWQEETELD